LREYARLAKKDVPDPPAIDDNAFWIVGLFYALRGCMAEYSMPITPGLMLDWQKSTGDCISADVAVIIMTMDRVYRHDLHELADKLSELRRE